MERFRRLVLWAVMLVLTLALFLRGHGPFKKGGSVAFLHEKVPCTTIRIAGNIVNSGIYTFPCDTDLITVIRMTVPDWRLGRADKRLLNRVLQNGDVLELIGRANQHIDISVKKMQVRELIALEIPLDPNQLQVDDWESLPGIGPSLAFQIVQDRQINGDFRSFRDLERVAGIGENKIKQLAKFF